MELGLKGKVAVITGGSAGIGLAVAEGLAAEGADLMLAARGAERVQSEAKRLATRFGVRAEGVACDIATRAGADALTAAVEKSFGGADILINNAGSGIERDGDGGAGREVASSIGTCTSWRRYGWPAALRR